MSLLEQNTTRNSQIDENATQLEFKVNNNEEYEVKNILDSAVYVKELEASHLPRLYYLVSWKGYLEEKDI